MRLARSAAAAAAAALACVALALLVLVAAAALEIARSATAQPAPASYVAMMASRRRAEGLLADLVAEGAPDLDKLHVPAGHNLGGKGAGEIALSVVAEIQAESYGRPGRPMRGPR